MDTSELKRFIPTFENANDLSVVPSLNLIEQKGLIHVCTYELGLRKNKKI